MPITPTNQVKNSITPTGKAKYGVFLWGDFSFTWGDSIATWGGLSLTPTNQVKNTITPTNRTKS